MSESNNLPQAISHKKLSYLMLKAQKDSHFSDELAEIESPEKREFEELLNNWEASTKKLVNKLSKIDAVRRDAEISNRFNTKCTNPTLSS